jgi:hypothetical protein
MSIVAEHFAFVVGVDTHARSNTYAIITTRTGARLDAATFPTSPAGIARALSWMMRRGAPRPSTAQSVWLGKDLVIPAANRRGQGPPTLRPPATFGG